MNYQDKPAEDYIEHEKALIRKMQEDNFSMFDGDRDEALDYMSTNLSRFTDYANVIIREQYLMPLWSATLSTEDCNNNRMNIDRERRLKHDCAIDSVNALNRLSEKYGLQPFADIDTTHREEVADFCGAFVNQVYNKGIGKDDGKLYGSMYAATNNRTQVYDTTQHSREIKHPDYMDQSENTTDTQYGQ
jgi:hypothetical protein